MPTRRIERAAHRVAQLPRATKVSIAFAVDAVAMPLALLVAVALRRDSLADALEVPAWFYAAAASICMGVFVALGTYRAVFRFISRDGLFVGALGVLASALLIAALNGVVLLQVISHNSIAIFAALALLYMLSSRSLVRELLYYRRGTRERVAIYGAGAAGIQLAGALRESGNYLPVAFIDADVTLHRRVLAGVKVFAPESLQKVISRRRVSSVLLALPSCPRRQRQTILKSLEPYPVRVRTVPDIGNIIAGHASLADVRDVDADDLLGRDPVAPNEALLDACIRGKVVLVTGAGGSIGSELCRQIVRLGPQRLLLLEISEPALYQIERELRMLTKSHDSDVEVVPLLGNARNRPRMRDIMQMYGVHTVYHAAAYKHVPIVEHNVLEGIQNNVYGSWSTAEAALESGVETFVLISTDKAVNPANVMGATKRLAELTLQALQERSTFTRFCMVRFGNVLESSGSVVPLFREQIKRGGPVTVTHKEIIRYFMTIPEASQLVLQAGSMAQGGDVFVLDMGEPVRIVDLARRMIHLMGMTVREESNPDGDIEITFTGLRPAEKLYEELLIGGNVTGTEHPMIMRAVEPYLPWQQLSVILEQMLAAVEACDCERARGLLLSTVLEYRPAADMQDLLWQRGRQTERERANVTELRMRRTRLLKGGSVVSHQ
jgi:UDP-N-acetylglucosamine 4,6-dehydratase